MYKLYEFIIILKNNNLNFILSFYNFLIYNKFLILGIENWGFLKFCYKIKNFSKGFFILFKFIIFDNFFLKYILNYLKLNNFILRFFFLFLKKDFNFITFDTFKKIFKKNELFKKNKKKN